MNECIVIYITTPTKFEAEKISKVLVEKKLASCANLIGEISSIFRWQNEIKNENEFAVIIKTTKKLLAKATETIKSLHSYECPCIIALPIIGGNEAFLDWINKEVL